MPIYTPPNFNILADIWMPPANPAAGPPTFTAVACQQYVYSRTPELSLHPQSGRWLPVIIIRVPFAFPITIVPDMIWKQTGSLPNGPKYYKVQWVVLMHAAFTNQYYAQYCFECNANGTIPKVPLPT